MNTVHKLQDEWLLSYAAGALDPGRTLMVASHLAYHDELQDAVANAEAIGGSLLEALTAADVSEDKLDELMSRLDDSVVPEVKPVSTTGGEYPQPLMEFLNCELESLNWRFMGPGMRNARLWNGPNDERLWLLRARGGIAVPEHGHSGDEWTLILKGSYRTELGQFRIGEMDVAGEDVIHQPLIDDGEECICLVMTEGPIRLKSLMARMIQPFFGL